MPKHLVYSHAFPLFGNKTGVGTSGECSRDLHWLPCYYCWGNQSQSGNHEFSIAIVCALLNIFIISVLGLFFIFYSNVITFQWTGASVSYHLIVSQSIIIWRGSWIKQIVRTFLLSPVNISPYSIFFYRLMSCDKATAHLFVIYDSGANPRENSTYGLRLLLRRSLAFQEEIPCRDSNVTGSRSPWQPKYLGHSVAFQNGISERTSGLVWSGNGILLWASLVWCGLSGQVNTGPQSRL